MSLDTNNFRENLENETFKALKIIGSIQEGYKLNSVTLQIQPVGYYTSFERSFLYHDNRLKTVEFFYRTVRNANFLLNEYKENTEKSLVVKNLINDLQKCKEGIRNIKKTYEEDVHFTSQMSTLLENIDIKLIKYDFSDDES